MAKERRRFSKQERDVLDSMAKFGAVLIWLHTLMQDYDNLPPEVQASIDELREFVRGLAQKGTTEPR